MSTLLAGTPYGRAKKHHEADEQLPRSKGRGLLALDGGHVTPSLLDEAQARCLEIADRVDILLVNPPRAPISLLHDLLVRLEQAGIDYRLTSLEGNLGEQIVHYLRRFLGISMVIVEALPALTMSMKDGCADLIAQGYDLIVLNEQELVT